MSTYSLSDGIATDAARSGSRSRDLLDRLRHAGPGIAAAIAWVTFGLSCLLWEDLGDWSRTHSLGIGAFVIAALAFFGTLSADFLGKAGTALRQRAPWLLVLGLLLTLWEVATAKFAWLPLPFFPPPQAIIEVYTDDLPKLLDSVFASVKLQLGGYVIGAAVGLSGQRETMSGSTCPDTSGRPRAVRSSSGSMSFAHRRAEQATEGRNRHTGRAPR